MDVQFCLEALEEALDIIGNKSYHEWRHFQP
jgi:hypothetical protein